MIMIQLSYLLLITPGITVIPGVVTSSSNDATYYATLWWWGKYINKWQIEIIYDSYWFLYWSWSYMSLSCYTLISNVYNVYSKKPALCFSNPIVIRECGWAYMGGSLFILHVGWRTRAMISRLLHMIWPHSNLLPAAAPHTRFIRHIFRLENETFRRPEATPGSFGRPKAAPRYLWVTFGPP